MERVRTTITLEDGRTFEPLVWCDPARHGLWFVEVGALARDGDHPEVGPFANEADARGYLLARVEREQGRVREVLRLAS